MQSKISRGRCISTYSIARVATNMQRAKQWTPEVENLFRYQAAGFRDQNEYLSVNEQPEN
jgi:hypothetical protein